MREITGMEVTAVPMPITSTRAIWFCAVPIRAPSLSRVLSSSAIANGKGGPTLLAAGIAMFLVAMLAGVAFSWTRASAAYRKRLASLSSV